MLAPSPALALSALLALTPGARIASPTDPTQFTPPAPAAPPSTAPHGIPTAPAPRRLAIAAITATPQDAAALALTLRGHLADLATEPAVEPLPEGAPARNLAWARERLAAGAAAALWIDTRPGAGTTLHLLLPAPERLYARHLDTPDDPLETREILGVVLRGLFSDAGDPAPPPDMEALDVPPPAAAAPPRDPPATATPPADATPPAPPPRTPRLLLGLAYAGSVYAPALPWASGLALALGLRGRRGLVLAVDAAGLLHAPLTPVLGAHSYSDARLRLGRAALALRLGLRRPLGARRRLFLEPALALRGEALIWRPLAGSRAEAGAGLRLALAPTLALGLDLRRGLALTLAAGLDLWLRNLDLVARTPAGTTPIIRASSVGATATAGLNWTI